MPLDARLWGKHAGLGQNARGTDHTHPLICHLLDTAAVAELVWDELLTGHQRSMVVEALQVSPGQARALAAFWAGLHDIGKISVPFQLHSNGPKHADKRLQAQELRVSRGTGSVLVPRRTGSRTKRRRTGGWWGPSGRAAIRTRGGVRSPGSAMRWPSSSVGTVAVSTRWSTTRTRGAPLRVTPVWVRAVGRSSAGSTSRRCAEWSGRPGFRRGG